MLGDLKMEVNAGINQDFMGINQTFQYQNIDAGMNIQKSTVFFYFIKLTSFSR